MDAPAGGDATAGSGGCVKVVGLPIRQPGRPIREPIAGADMQTVGMSARSLGCVKTCWHTKPMECLFSRIAFLVRAFACATFSNDLRKSILRVAERIEFSHIKAQKVCCQKRTGEHWLAPE